uniref:SKICH domain-containing protein n=1 Tax=Sphaeramia orbicularis TaxID=375764 RepID=A0A673BLU7_9TELE
YRLSSAVLLQTDAEATVVFRNVGQLYFPQTRVECHYSLTSEHQWSNSDWIGIFEVGWSTVKEYYTYTWALVPENYTEGTNVNCCALFHGESLAMKPQKILQNVTNIVN